MDRPTEPLRREHRELLPHVEGMRHVADKVGTAPDPALAAEIEHVYDFLAHHLVPHAHAEDQVLYPVVARLMGAPQATATMSRDHVEVGRLTADIALFRARLTRGPLSTEERGTLRRVLYGLYALVKVHFSKEEEIYLPLLDAHLSAEEAERVFKEMEVAAAKARGSGVPRSAA